jgi:uncharacterized protein (TIGR03437 family)
MDERLPRAVLVFCAFASMAGAQTIVESPRATVPAITAIVNSASGQPGIVSGAWATIYGTGLSQTTRAWMASDFVNGQLPPELDYISVRVNGLAAFIGYVSPTQINMLVPDDPSIGAASVQASGQLLQSNIVYVPKPAVQPALFGFTPQYPAAVHLDGSSVGPPGLIPGVVTTPAKPGETIVLFGTAFGPSNPPIATGYLFTLAEPLAQTVTASVGGTGAAVSAWLVMPGVCQLNLTVPTVADGDQALAVSVGGASILSGMFISVGH